MEQLLVLLAMVVGWALLRYAAGQLGSPAGSPSDTPESRDAMPAQAPRADPPQVALEVPDPTPPGNPRRRRGAHFGPASEWRRAVVLMTILGPCRALVRQDAPRTALDERPNR